MAGSGSPDLVAIPTRLDLRRVSDASSSAPSGPAISESDGETTETEDQYREPRQEHRPVEATPGDGSTALAGPIGIEGESATATPRAMRAPKNTAQIGPRVASAANVGLSAPRDRRTPRSPRLSPQSSADGLTANQQGGQARRLLRRLRGRSLLAWSHAQPDPRRLTSDGSCRWIRGEERQRFPVRRRAQRGHCQYANP